MNCAETCFHTLLISNRSHKSIIIISHFYATFTREKRPNLGNSFDILKLFELKIRMQNENANAQRVHNFNSRRF